LFLSNEAKARLIADICLPYVDPCDHAANLIGQVS